MALSSDLHPPACAADPANYDLLKLSLDPHCTQVKFDGNVSNVKDNNISLNNSEDK